MKLLLDTHLLLWAVGMPEKLSKSAMTLLCAEENNLFFSAASLWEIMIKASLKKKNFQIDVPTFRRGLLDNAYTELPILTQHVLALEGLASPFDRILIAQATVEGYFFVTADTTLRAYTGPLLFV